VLHNCDPIVYLIWNKIILGKYYSFKNIQLLDNFSIETQYKIGLWMISKITTQKQNGPLKKAILSDLIYQFRAVERFDA
jgi:hypothetical protein